MYPHCITSLSDIKRHYYHYYIGNTTHVRCPQDLPLLPHYYRLYLKALRFIVYKAFFVKQLNLKLYSMLLLTTVFLFSSVLHLTGNQADAGGALVTTHHMYHDVECPCI